MSEFPAMPIFADTWVGDTHPDLSLEEQGCYWLLICFAWLRPRCDLPADDAWIAKRLAVDMRTWKRLRPRVLLRFWTLSEGNDGLPRWTQKKQQSVREVVEKSSIANRQAALSRWHKSDAKPTRNKDLANANAHADGYANAMPPILSNPKNNLNLKSRTLLPGVLPGVLPAASVARSPVTGRAPSADLGRGQYQFDRDADRRSPPRSEPLPVANGHGVHVSQHSEAYAAWWKHLREPAKLDAKGGWTFETEYPPAPVNPAEESEEIPF